MNEEWRSWPVCLTAMIGPETRASLCPNPIWRTRRGRCTLVTLNCRLARSSGAGITVDTTHPRMWTYSWWPSSNCTRGRVPPVLHRVHQVQLQLWLRGGHGGDTSCLQSLHIREVGTSTHGGGIQVRKIQNKIIVWSENSFYFQGMVDLYTALQV